MRRVNQLDETQWSTIDETPTEVTDSWSLHGATYSIGSIPKISVFITTGQGTSGSTHLEKFTKVKRFANKCETVIEIL